MYLCISVMKFDIEKVVPYMDNVEISSNHPLK